VRSNADDVDGYLALVPEERRAVLSRLRDACRDLLPGFEECMSYGMPAYRRDGFTEISEPRACLLNVPRRPQPFTLSGRSGR